MKTRRDPKYDFDLYCEGCQEHIYTMSPIKEERYYCKNCYHIYRTFPVDSLPVVECMYYKNWIRPK